ncbi:PREDICTED: transcription factor bHLH70-like isoform X2 [Camelina sativa]|uniref:Transcription factor bHLH70-like isoform X2 n=1 Tax=Camelina sativa TaxID=90675 RepID=A0ABM0ZNS8_CAMSA|nr:PREDICTED: transcription factor bHLH70-like isoform X2 [Camelina sativa]
MFVLRASNQSFKLHQQVHTKMKSTNPLICLDQKVNVRRSLQVQGSVEDHQGFAFGEEQLSTPSLLQDTTIPFLQMLQQSEEPSSFLSIKEPNFLALLSLQTLEKPNWELESYLPHEVPEFHSPIHSETYNHYYQNSYFEGFSEAISGQKLPFNPLQNTNPRRKRKNNNLVTPMTRERRKRRRTKPTKNIEEMESQRMTHIAVERNRRRQMNVHLNSLRSLIPSSYIQRGDQASIVGGAIDFVKILEQHLQALEAQKTTQQSTDSKEQIPEEDNNNNSLRDISSNKLRASKEEEEEETSRLTKIDATVIESHVNLKIQCTRKQGQLLRSIILLEKLGFTVLHLNITSPTNTSVSYSFNLKMEDDCNLGSADEIKAAIRQIFD